MKLEQISKRIMKEHISISIGWGHRLSFIEWQDEWKWGKEIALLHDYRWATAVPLNKWLGMPKSNDPFAPVLIHDHDEITVGVEDYRAFGLTSEAELVAHVMSEAVKYVKFINFV